jgi:hypothetical protein
MIIHVHVNLSWVVTLEASWDERGDVSIQTVRIIAGFIVASLQHAIASQALSGSTCGQLGDFSWRTES